jgi:hypothetical protein
MNGAVESWLQKAARAPVSVMIVCSMASDSMRALIAKASWCVAPKYRANTWRA